MKKGSLYRVETDSMYEYYLILGYEMKGYDAVLNKLLDGIAGKMVYEANLQDIKPLLQSKTLYGFKLCRLDRFGFNNYELLPEQEEYLEKRFSTCVNYPIVSQDVHMLHLSDATDMHKSVDLDNIILNSIVTGKLSTDFICPEKAYKQLKDKVNSVIAEHKRERDKFYAFVMHKEEVSPQKGILYLSEDNNFLVSLGNGYFLKLLLNTSSASLSLDTLYQEYLYIEKYHDKSQYITIATKDVKCYKLPNEVSVEFDEKLEQLRCKYEFMDI